MNAENSYIIPEEERITIVHERKIACSGVLPPHDHPIVYYSILQPGGDGASAVKGDDNTAVCGYCGMKYVYEENTQ